MTKKSWCKVCAAAWQREYNEANKDRLREQRLQRYAALRYQALVRYSQDPPSCDCCGEDTLEFLVLDHINGGGNAHRRTFKAASIYHHLRAEDWPDGYRVLCENCNGSLGRYGYCPHKASSPRRLTPNIQPSS